MNERDIVRLVERDAWMMEVLRAAAALALPDWMIGAGFVRSKVWDTLHGYTERTPVPDIDVIYFDPADCSEEAEERLQERLREKMPLQWSVTNQARMHVENHEKPYKNSEDALAHWVETPTCVAVTLRAGRVELIAPHGIADLVNLVVRPSPLYSRGIALYRERVKKKRWQERWPKLKILDA